MNIIILDYINSIYYIISSIYYIINSIYILLTLTTILLIYYIINYYNDINLINNSRLIKYPFY